MVTAALFSTVLLPIALLHTPVVLPNSAASASRTYTRTASVTAMASPFRIRQRIKNLRRSRTETVSDGEFGLPPDEVAEPQVDVAGTEDSPPMLSDEICLVPGMPVVRVEVAPGNARRIFTGIDIVAECGDVCSVVWNLLTDYENLPKAVPNLAENEVLERYTDGGAMLRQVGAAKLAPMMTFKATTTLEVRPYLQGLPTEMEQEHLDLVESSDSELRAAGLGLPLTKGKFPRPYCISALPHRDITMQGVANEGDFRFYQGVWRMQELPACAPPGSSAMRLTYSVELSPRALVPVALLEGQIASTLGDNLVSIRDFVQQPSVLKQYSKSLATAQPM